MRTDAGLGLHGLLQLRRGKRAIGSNPWKNVPAPHITIMLTFLSKPPDGNCGGPSVRAILSRMAASYDSNRPSRSCRLGLVWPCPADAGFFLTRFQKCLEATTCPLSPCLSSPRVEPGGGPLAARDGLVANQQGDRWGRIYGDLTEMSRNRTQHISFSKSGDPLTIGPGRFSRSVPTIGYC